jgi:cbb3-type cytochrome oxidase subunit 3
MDTKGALSRAVLASAGVAGSAVFLAGCDDTPAQPTTVVVNTPPADGGQMVLLTVMVGAAFLAVISAGVLAWAWAQERRARRDAENARREAEDAVLALTGRPMARVRFALLQRGPTPAQPARSDECSPRLSGRRAIEGWDT